MPLKYVTLGVGILTGNPVAITLAIPALGLNATKDVLEVTKPNDENVKQIPTGMGEALGMVVDKTTEKITGEESNGMAQTIGGLVESIFGVKDILNKPLFSDNTIENIDKANSLLGLFNSSEEIINKIAETKKSKAQKEEEK